MARDKKPATGGDMVRSLLVLLIPVVLITWFFSRDLGDYPAQEVDYSPVLAQARREAPYPVLAPEGLPETWRPTQVSWIAEGQPHLNDEPSVRNLWQLGFLDPHDVFISVNQGDEQPERFVAEETRDGVVDGKSAVGEETWVRYVSPDERTRSLVRTAPEVTTVVVGDTTYEALEAFASTLSAS
ncbi:MAG TPA: DUF4245 domain-containing protein [Microlunatus sp.]|nr:DUF4245 domain-containing protein [Microlunatus sp.]